MEHSYDDIHSDRNSYLNKKRFNESNNIANIYQYNKKERYDRIIQYNDINNFRYSPFKPNYNYNYNPSYINYNNYYSRNYYNGNYKKSNEKKVYKKSFVKSYGEGVRNISNCEIIFPQSQSLFLNENMEENSYKSVSDSTNFTSQKELSNQFNSSKDSQKFASYYITEKSQFFHPKNFKNKQYNTSNKTEDYDLSLSRINQRNKEIICFDNIKIMDEEQEKIYEKKLEFPDVFQKLSKYEFFNKNLIKIEENPLDNFIVYPQKLFSFTENIIKKNNIINNNEKNDISLESCYLLAKIPNWRMVSKFVPIQKLKLENFETIFEKSKEKNEKIDGEKKNNFVYSEKYEDLVENCLDNNRNKKKEINKDIYNRKRIIGQYHYDIIILKNKINQSKFQLNYLDAKNEELSKNINEYY
jgi:hypothetical protein